MAGRTTFVIAHRLSTIALADEIVVLEDGRDRGARHARRAARSAAPLYAEIAAKGLPDQVFRDREPTSVSRVCDARPERHARRAAPPPAPDRRARAQAARAARSCCAPTARRTLLMLGSLLLATAAALAPPPLAKLAIDDGIVPGRPHRADVDRGRVPAHGADLLGRDLRADLPDRLGRPAGAAGPADPALRAPADAVGRLLLAPPGGRADLAPDQRRAGARPARLRRRRDAVRLDADADRHGGDPDRARPRAGAADVPRLPGAGDRLARVPDRLRRRLPAHAREGRGDHRLPAGDAVGHPRRALVRPGGAPHRRASPSSTTRTATRT